MILYHGSNIAVKTVELKLSRHLLDFGSGFYMTSDYDQAAKWAIIKTKRLETGCACVSVFDVSEVVWKTLKIQMFTSPNYDWLRFVNANRHGAAVECDADVVIGPVANDNTMPVLNLYFSGAYTEDEALRRLLPQKLKNQFAFKTEHAIEALLFKEVVVL
ncbi:MAG: DUF3990 domain-containing protein [Victivallales bacterium]|nr:DUF3990 domain-containing protein [Victivallales bacterium]